MPHTQSSPHCESEHGSVHDLVVKPDILSSQLNLFKQKCIPPIYVALPKAMGCKVIEKQV